MIKRKTLEIERMVLHNSLGKVGYLIIALDAQFLPYLSVDKNDSH